MILTCPSCQKRFQVPEGALGDSGRKVKCSSCAHVWFQAPIADEAPPPQLSVVDTAAPCDTADREDMAAETEGFRPAPTWPGDAEAEADEGDVDEEVDEEGGAAAQADRDEAGDGAAVSWPSRDETDDNVVMQWPSHDDPARQPMSQFDVNSVAESSRARQREPKGGGLWVMVVVLVIVIAFGLYQWRDVVVRNFPQTIPAYVAAGLIAAPTSRDLKLEGVAFEVRDEGSDTVLDVTGRVVNTGGETRQLPRLRGELLDADGQVVSFWVFTADAPILGPGEATAFQNVYRNPPIGGGETDLFVTFEDLR